MKLPQLASAENQSFYALLLFQFHTHTHTTFLLTHKRKKAELLIMAVSTFQKH